MQPAFVRLEQIRISIWQERRIILLIRLNDYSSKVRSRVQERCQVRVSFYFNEIKAFGFVDLFVECQEGEDDRSKSIVCVQVEYKFLETMYRVAIPR